MANGDENELGSHETDSWNTIKHWNYLSAVMGRDDDSHWVD